jgi:hypothetical protein
MVEFVVGGRIARRLAVALASMVLLILLAASVAVAGFFAGADRV